MKSRLKKAALVGVGAYAGYKVAKLATKFSRPGFGNSYKFNDWNDWREADGFLCRSNKDCKWIDDNLNCEDYELDFTPLVSPIFIKFHDDRLKSFEGYRVSQGKYLCFNLLYLADLAC